MAQSLKSKIRKLSDQYNIDSIVQTATEVRDEMKDELAWNVMNDNQKTDWFINQCKHYNLTTEIIEHKNKPFRIIVKEFHGKHYDKAYFTVFLARSCDEPWHLEIGGAYTGTNNGGIWSTNRGLKGKERQIAEVMRLHNLGE